MVVIDPGHKYELNHLDGNNKETLIFVKRDGDKYPGNVGHYEGTNLQEVIRVLIDRVKYLNNQIYDDRNMAIINYLRNCIWLLEDRAADRHQRDFDIFPNQIELESFCSSCGHIGCIGKCN